eukprot:5886566-Prymnesium_polylepis.2
MIDVLYRTACAAYDQACDRQTDVNEGMHDYITVVRRARVMCVNALFTMRMRIAIGRGMIHTHEM